jgi:hypothetical protein
MLALPLAASPAASDSVGTLPGPATSQPAPKDKKAKVRPGDTHTNGDGVTVTNDKESTGDATVDPKEGNAESDTTVVCKTGFQGTVSGLDFTDTVRIRSNSTATVTSNDGGNVQLSGGSTVTVTNTSGDGGRPINVTTGGGTSVSIPPGSSATFNS